MTLLYIIIGCLVGVGVGFALPTISYTASNYLAIAIVAALDSVFGGIASSINKKFDLKVFISGFFVNAVLAMLLTFLGQKLNVDIYLAAIVVFVGRMFNNLGIIRRYYLEKIENHKKNNNTENNGLLDEGILMRQKNHLYDFFARIKDLSSIRLAYTRWSLRTPIRLLNIIQ